MRQRLLLTGFWAAFFLVALGSVWAYSEIPAADGILRVLPEQRMQVLQPVLTLYGLYFGGILAFWFARPFPQFNLRIVGVERVRFWIALACTLVFNVACLALILRAHIVADMNVVNDVQDAVRLGKYLSWVVAPANAYYFGTKSD